MYCGMQKEMSVRSALPLLITIWNIGECKRKCLCSLLNIPADGKTWYCSLLYVVRSSTPPLFKVDKSNLLYGDSALIILLGSMWVARWVVVVSQAYSRFFNHSWSYHRLQVGFGGVCRCMAGDLMWPCLVWAERSTPGNFWVPSHRFNSATGEQTGITQTICGEVGHEMWKLQSTGLEPLTCHLQLARLNIRPTRRIGEEILLSRSCCPVQLCINSGIVACYVKGFAVHLIHVHG